MVDITNRIDEADISSSRYDMAVSPSKLMNTAVGDALTSFGNLVEGAATVIDNQIKRNIQTDLFNAVDQADAELGVNERVAEEASIDLPEPIKANMNKMGNYKEAVSQGRMSESQFYNRMDSVVRQLRVKYPGYREEIDKLSGQVLGFDTANTIRKRMFAERDQAAVAAAKRTEDDAKLIEEAAKVGLDYTQTRQAQLQLNTQGYIDDDLKQGINQSYLSALALKAKQERVAKDLTIGTATHEVKKRNIKGLANELQSKDNRDIFTLGVPRGPDGKTRTIEELYNEYRKDGLTREEASSVMNIISQMKIEASKRANEFWNTNIQGTNDTFGTYFPPSEKTYDGGLALVNEIEKALFGDNLDEVKRLDYLMKLDTSNIASQIYKVEGFAALKTLKDQLGPDAILYAGQTGTLRDVSKNVVDVANAYIANAYNSNTPFAQTIDTAVGNNAPLSTNEYVQGLVQANNQISTLYKSNPEGAYKIFKQALGPNSQGQHLLMQFSVQDRVKVFSQLASPEFSSFVKTKGTEQMKTEYRNWLSGSFEAAFREDISNISSLSAQDMIGYQLSYSPKDGFKLTRESTGASVFSDVVQSLATNEWGVAQWNKSIERVNQFMTAYKNALPESLSEKQEAEVLNQMIQSLGVGTSPSQAGGFWSQLSTRVNNWITSGDSNVQVDPTSGVTTMAEFLGTDEAVSNLYENKTNVDTAVKTAWGEGRGESTEGRIAIYEVLRNRALASGRSIDEEAKKGDGSQFNAWKKSDKNYDTVTGFNDKNPEYETYVQEFLTSANSDITKGATHYYNPDQASPSWEKLFVETARIGKHRFGYLKKDDPYRKKLSKYRNRSEFD